MRNHSKKIRLICMKMDVQVKLVFMCLEWFRTKTRFDAEAKGNSEKAYFLSMNFWLESFAHKRRST